MGRGRPTPGLAGGDRDLRSRRLPRLSPLALAAYGWWAARRRGHFWGWTAILFALLALGPTLQVAGATRFSASPGRSHCPTVSCMHSPDSRSRASPRASPSSPSLPSPSSSGSASPAWPAGRRCCGAHRRGWRSSLLWWPARRATPRAGPTDPLRATSLPRLPGAAGAPGTILDIPYYPEDTLSLRYQTIHRQPIVGGYLSRDLDYPLLGLPPFPSLLHQPSPPDIVAGEPPDLALATLAAANVRWVVVNLDLIPPGQPRLAPELAAALAATPAYEDAHFAVYRPLPLPNPQSPRLVVVPARGWDEPEKAGPEGRSMRWFAREADLSLWNLSTIAQRATLRFAAASFHRARELRVSVDGREVGRYRIDGWQVARGPGRGRPGAASRHAGDARCADAPGRCGDRRRSAHPGDQRRGCDGGAMMGGRILRWRSE